MSNNQVRLKWKPDVYNKLSLAQNNAVTRLLKDFRVRKNAEILDVGCGDGMISAKLSKIAKKGYVLGVDKSTEMIDFAVNNYNTETHPNLKFVIKDAQSINYRETFDLVFSSFALQWFEDKKAFFSNVYTALKKKGQICVVVPLSVSAELEAATSVVMNRSKWKSSFNDFKPNWHFIDDESILQLVEDNMFEVSYASSYVQEVKFSSLEDFQEYVLLWFPYLAPLKRKLKPKFFSQVIEEYCKFLPPSRDGSIIMKIPVISLLASKINP